ncbi:MAG: hypothetical protein QHC67_14725 [Sphingobium sp.]|uniref:hypothetical protein n=1 Tax=Sphingobium sp. TaxID=1912891 RepID=UPI0029AEE30B|nr:hypothetical protein [Sphingobium sp.]MDX3911056.1 hypothetical protein [Sphingobium sp.]
MTTVREVRPVALVMAALFVMAAARMARRPVWCGVFALLAFASAFPVLIYPQG